MPSRLFEHVPKIEARAAGAALGVGVALTSIKFLGYYLTGSAVIFSDAIESIVNLAAGGFALYSLVVAHRPADESHPYGHGKIEFLSAGFEGGMILIAAVVALLKAIDVLKTGKPEGDTAHLTLAVLLMTVALAVNGGMGWYLIRIGRRHGSLTLESDGHHLLSDAWTSVATLVTLAALRLGGGWWVDPVGAIVISLFMGWVAFGLLRRAEAGLTDRQDQNDARLLTGILDQHLQNGGREPLICGYHKLRHRHTGRYHWVDFHLQVPPSWDVRRGHEVASKIEREMEESLGFANATAHVEPCGAESCAHCQPLPASTTPASATA